MFTSPRDYSSISPSATGLLLAKGLTQIPYAAEAAQLIWGGQRYQELAEQAKTEIFLKRLIHFENRYWTVDELLQLTGIRNILEIGAGFSFRGLAMTADASISYIDSDLPEVIERKKKIIAHLVAQHQLERDNLALTTLNALDGQAFLQQLSLLPEGPVVILNEGLLVYLNELEKKKLCAIVHNALMERGGYWITGDIYIRRPGNGEEEIPPNDKTAQFLASHHVEENKFSSFEAAAAFFEHCGFAVEKKLVRTARPLDGLALLKQYYPSAAESTSGYRHIRETWLLKAVFTGAPTGSPAV
jgi:O-methyltransferase involved in polyketide biosynthesis